MWCVSTSVVTPWVSKLVKALLKISQLKFKYKTLVEVQSGQNTGPDKTCCICCMRKPCGAQTAAEEAVTSAHSNAAEKTLAGTKVPPG